MPNVCVEEERGEGDGGRPAVRTTGQFFVFWPTALSEVALSGCFARCCGLLRLIKDVRRSDMTHT